MIDLNYCIAVLVTLFIPTSQVLFIFSLKKVLPAIKREKAASATELKAAAKRSFLFWAIGTGCLCIVKVYLHVLNVKWLTLWWASFVTTAFLWYLAKKKEK